MYVDFCFKKFSKEESKEDEKPYKKKDFVAAWGKDSNEELSLSGFGKGNCLMKKGDKASSEAFKIQSSNPLDSLINCGQDH